MRNEEFCVREIPETEVEPEDAGFFYFLPDDALGRGPFKTRKEALETAIAECEEASKDLESLRTHVASLL